MITGKLTCTSKIQKLYRNTPCHMYAKQKKVNYWHDNDVQLRYCAFVNIG